MVAGTAVKPNSQTPSKAKTSMAKKQAPEAKTAVKTVAPKAPPAKSGAEQMLEAHPALKTTVAQIEKEFGEGAIMPLGVERTGVIEGISTGSLSLDIALGGRGIPRGRVVEVFGPE